MSYRENTNWDTGSREALRVSTLESEQEDFLQKWNTSSNVVCDGTHNFSVTEKACFKLFEPRPNRVGICTNFGQSSVTFLNYVKEDYPDLEFVPLSNEESLLKCNSIDLNGLIIAISGEEEACTEEPDDEETELVELLLERFDHVPVLFIFDDRLTDKNYHKSVAFLSELA